MTASDVGSWALKCVNPMNKGDARVRATRKAAALAVANPAWVFGAIAVVLGVKLYQARHQ